jgi:hypothetical protein
MDETDLKQHYLRDEVIDQNYDAGEFLKFLVEKYGENAADIDQYNMVSLKKIVAEFKEHANPCTDAVEEIETVKDNKNEEIQENNNNDDDQIKNESNKDSTV